MRLIADTLSPLGQQWADALRPMVIRHPNPASTVELVLDADTHPHLTFRLDVGWDTTDPSHEFRPLVVSAVALTYFPGVAVARAWVAASWVSYLMHEALELCTVGDLRTRPIDPHGPDVAFDRCFRAGMPPTLTPTTLLAALAVVMTIDEARAMVGVSACPLLT